MSNIIKCSGMPTNQSFAEWKQKLIDEFGEANISYREVGKNGWDRLNIVDDNPAFEHHKGPHWTDAAPRLNNPLVGSGKLLGTYYHNDEIGKQFFSIQTQ